MHRWAWVLVACVVAPLRAEEVSSPARVVASSDWDDGTAQGWPALLAGPGGSYDLLDTGGNPGGHVLLNDLSSEESAPPLEAPPAFRGDYRLLEDGCIALDARASRFDENVGLPLILAGPGGLISFSHETVVTTEWRTYVFPFERLRETVTEASWEALAADVAVVQPILDVVDGTGPDGRIDNFRLIGGGEGILIDFDDVEGQGIFAVAPDRYRDSGLVFDGDVRLEDVRDAEPHWIPIAVAGGASLPNGLFLGTNPMEGRVQLRLDARFVVPGTMTPGTTDYVRVYVFDANLGTTVGALEARDSAGRLLARREATTDEVNGARFEIRAPGIARITLEQDSDSGLFDNLFFHTPRATGGNQLPGDCNQDGRLDISDAVCVFRLLFALPEGFPCGDGSSDDPANLALLDWDASGGALNLTDGVAALEYLFRSGPPHPRAVTGDEGTACVSIAGCPQVSSCARSLSPAPSAAGLVIYVTSSAEAGNSWYRGPGDLDPLRRGLEVRGFEGLVTVADNAAHPRITPELLEGAAQVWLLEGDPDGDAELDEESVRALLDFVANGGSLWVSVEGNGGGEVWNEDTRSLLEGFGLEVRPGSAMGAVSPSVVQAREHPIFRGVDRLTFDGLSGVLDVGSAAPPAEVLWWYETASEPVPGVVLLDGTGDGKGRVIIDTGWLLGYAYCEACPAGQPPGSDDRRFAYNVADFLDPRRR